jgi:hypothetical protein
VRSAWFNDGGSSIDHGSVPAVIGPRRCRHAAYSPTLACIIPPSATYVVAVPYEAASEARNATSRAISSGSATRPSGIALSS